MVREPKEYKSQFNYVKVESLQRINIDKRDWTCGLNYPLEDGEEAIVARDGRGMEFYFDNGFFNVLDENPDVAEGAPEPNDEDSFLCDECDEGFDSERGLNTHARQKHNNKKEDEDE